MCLFSTVLLLVCQTTESLTDEQVNLGQNMTLDCQIDVKEIYWVFQKLTDSPVLILRTFSSGSTKPVFYDERFKDKYSSLTLSRLFINNITIDELGIYYCVKTTRSGPQLSNGTRLYITEAVRDHNQTEVNNNSQCPNTPQALIVLYAILSIVIFLAIIGLLQIKLQERKKRHKQCQDEQLYSTNAEEFSAVEFRLSRPINNTFGKKPSQT
ncbi:uncharacterized protein LOC125263655 isoform X1 [Megalobrama amblycephala]|uniref:uncharacterized protein LOC125263655 isoform X1 n=1 Tax=Megalobrama amblycephala TaxID=75352 RepID=UPI0020143A90|nr:uncharacterized protein LOC125263655 isoform X1 [Megalobrama amblycephala]